MDGSHKGIADSVVGVGALMIMTTLGRYLSATSIVGIFLFLTFLPAYAQQPCRQPNQPCPISAVAPAMMQFSLGAVEDAMKVRRDRLQSPLSNIFRNPIVARFAPEQGERDYDGIRALAYGEKDLKLPAFKIAPSTPMWGVWGDLSFDLERRRALGATDLDHKQLTWGVQGGFDKTFANIFSPGDNVIAGITASWMSSHVSFTGSPTTFDLEGPGIGLYATWIKGQFSADFTVKVDFLDLKLDYAGVAPNTAVGLTNFGLNANMQRKYWFSQLSFYEPTIGLSYMHQDWANAALGVGLKNANTLRLQAGVRFGAVYNQNGFRIEPAIQFLAYDNVIAESVSIVPVKTDEGRLRGEFSPKVTIDFNNGTSAYLKSSVRFGSELIGGDVRLGVVRVW